MSVAQRGQIPRVFAPAAPPSFPRWILNSDNVTKGLLQNVKFCNRPFLYILSMVDVGAAICRPRAVNNRPYGTDLKMAGSA